MSSALMTAAGLLSAEAGWLDLVWYASHWADGAVGVDAAGHRSVRVDILSHDGGENGHRGGAAGAVTVDIAGTGADGELVLPGGSAQEERSQGHAGPAGGL